MQRLSRKPFTALASSAIIETAPLGNSRRRFFNAAILVQTPLQPNELIEKLHRIERKAGRQRRCRTWSARPLDLDIILWSGGRWASNSLVIPHRSFRERSFVLEPLSQIARDWRDPVTNFRVSQLLARYKKPRRLHQAG
jgi:2-amino-4-hydroxy-6-hydroxymethyldihydropteridine diphosphokinase